MRGFRALFCWISFTNDRFTTTAPPTLVSGLDTKKIALEFFETTDEDGRFRALAARRPAEHFVLGILYFVLQAVIVVLHVKAYFYVNAINYFQGRCFGGDGTQNFSVFACNTGEYGQDHARSCMQL